MRFSISRTISYRIRKMKGIMDLVLQKKKRETKPFKKNKEESFDIKRLLSQYSCL